MGTVILVGATVIVAVPLILIAALVVIGIIGGIVNPGVRKVISSEKKVKGRKKNRSVKEIHTWHSEIDNDYLRSKYGEI